MNLKNQPDVTLQYLFPEQAWNLSKLKHFGIFVSRWRVWKCFFLHYFFMYVLQSSCLLSSNIFLICHCDLLMTISSTHTGAVLNKLTKPELIQF